MKNKRLLILLLVFSIMGSFLSSGNFVYGDKIDTDVINEKWGKPTFVYGGGLKEIEIKETQSLLDIDNVDNVVSIGVSGQDLIKYLGSGSGNTSSMISSVLVQKQDKDTGVEVIINTPDNITQITRDQYANASITAGVTDAKIVVASIRKVTGESALTGVFKAFDVNGDLLDQDRMEVAQEELETVNIIVQKNKDDENFSTEDFNKAIAEIKEKLAELKDRTDKLATKEDIERIINEALEKYNLENIISRDQIDRLINLFEKYQNTKAIDSKEVLNQLKDFKDKIGDIYQDAKDSGIIDRIIEFFSNLFKSIFKAFG